MLPTTNRYSWYSLVLLGIIAVWVAFNLTRWQRLNVIEYDVNSYYAYLPAAFIYNDLSFGFKASLPADFEGDIWLNEAPNGGKVVKTSMGIAYLYMPFFLVAHGIAKATGDKANGYTSIYHFFIAMAGIFYCMLGLIFLRKLLLYHFSDRVTALVLLTLFMGTNLFYYTVVEGGMGHVYSFCSITIALWYTIQWVNSRNAKYLLLLGLLMGIIFIIRPTNALIGLFPLLYGISSMAAFRSRLQLIFGKPLALLGALALAFVPILPQLLFWKLNTGDWLYYSYGEETFFFGNPKLWNGLFGFRSGFLLYTPVMLLAFAGIYYVYRAHNKLFIASVLIILLHVYVSFSWWCWWYGGSFGARSMIDFYGLFALGLGAFITHVATRQRFVKGVLVTGLAFFAVLNLFQTYQFRKAILHWDGMTAKAYVEIFGKSSKPPNVEALLKHPNYDAARAFGREEEISD